MWTLLPIKNGEKYLCRMRRVLDCNSISRWSKSVLNWKGTSNIILKTKNMKLKTSMDDKQYCVCYKGKIESQFSHTLWTRYPQIHKNSYLNFWVTHIQYEPNMMERQMKNSH